MRSPPGRRAMLSRPTPGWSYSASERSLSSSSAKRSGTCPAWARVVLALVPVERLAEGAFGFFVSAGGVQHLGEVAERVALDVPQSLAWPTRRRVPRDDPAPSAPQSLPQPCQQSPIRATKKPLCRAFSMGGTGLEPVTPSLSILRTDALRLIRTCKSACTHSSAPEPPVTMCAGWCVNARPR
jgi:hypothetical protein